MGKIRAMSLFKRSSENQEIMKNKEHLTHNQVVPGSSPGTQVDIYNIHGQLIKSCKAEEFDDVYLSLPHSVYIINKIDNLGQLLSAEKVVK